ncbi:hypothetical protein [Yersinia enterocolitica]|uniref:hypothetical protein n=1 Tax=Yersinia enterocolitica TaxID=630 RepID=UPI003D06CF7B
MDITKSQSDFEAWHRDKYKTKWSSGQPTRDMHNGKYADHYTVPAEQERWELWQASRESIEVELPTQDEYDDPLSAYNAISDCKKILRTAGIRIKGESE